MKNRLGQVSLAELNEEELQKIKKLEKEMNDRFYLIAFEKE